jgi:hypothetical protein
MLETVVKSKAATVADMLVNYMESFPTRTVFERTEFIRFLEQKGIESNNSYYLALVETGTVVPFNVPGTARKVGYLKVK